MAVAATPPSLLGTWTEPKPGNEPGENEDAVVVRSYADGSTLIMLADGASSTVYAGEWARLLSESVDDSWIDSTDEELATRLNVLRAEFAARERPTTAWYVSRKFDRDGSQATMLAIRMRPTTAAVDLSVLAVGDCAVIVVEPNGASISFPLTSPLQFTNAPNLVGTRPDQPVEFQRWSYDVRPGAVVLAGTDAVGQCLLTQLQAGRWNEIFEAISQLPADGTGLRDALAAVGELHEDDVTLVAYRTPAGSTMEPHRTSVLQQIAKFALAPLCTKVRTASRLIRRRSSN